jgi:hypothetical protein
MRRAFGQIQTSVLVSQEFYKLCKENHIKFSEALRVGIGVMLAEKGIREYDSNLNIFRKIQVINKNLSKTSQKFYDLLEQAKEKGLDVSKFECQTEEHQEAG